MFVPGIGVADASTGWSALGDVTPYPTMPQIKEAIQETLAIEEQPREPSAIEMLAEDHEQFLNVALEHQGTAFTVRAEVERIRGDSEVVVVDGRREATLVFNGRPDYVQGLAPGDDVTVECALVSTGTPFGEYRPRFICQPFLVNH